VVNAAGPLELRATASAASSTYAGIVRLVEAAATERPPFVRMADRYAAWFLPITVLLAGGAWLASGDPVRALAVLVVATPCPLILAAPAAIVGGLSNAAKRGIIVKGGGALEALAGGEVVLLDKTGTVTAGRPSVARVHTVEDVEVGEVLRLAGSLEQVSVHPFAPAVVAAATGRGEVLDCRATCTRTSASGSPVASARWRSASASSPTSAPIRCRDAAAGDASEPAGGLLDRPRRGRRAGHRHPGGHRPDPRRDAAALRDLRRAGIGHVLLVTGDRAEVGELVGEAVGVDRVLADRSPSREGRGHPGRR
jgi:cation transport ATPase